MLLEGDDKILKILGINEPEYHKRKELEDNITMERT